MPPPQSAGLGWLGWQEQSSVFPSASGTGMWWESGSSAAFVASVRSLAATWDQRLGGGLDLPVPCSPGSRVEHCFRLGLHWCPWVVSPPWARTGRACSAYTARPTCLAPGPGEAALGSGCGMHPEPLKERAIPVEYIF